MEVYEEPVEFYNESGEKLVGVFHHAHNDNKWRNINMVHRLENKMAVVVEDEQMIGDVVAMALENIGMHPVCVCKQYEDIQSHHLTNGGLYVLDHDNKFGINGTDFLSKNNIPKDRIILTSGKDSWQKYVDRGYDFLAKPFRIEELYTHIRGLKL